MQLQQDSSKDGNAAGGARERKIKYDFFTDKLLSPAPQQRALPTERSRNPTGEPEQDAEKPLMISV